jgi:hypothetical protein
VLIDVRSFCQRVESDLNGLIDDLQSLTGRYGTSETMAWQASLPKLSVLLAKPHLQDFHLYLSESGSLSLEYRLPASSSWCDVVMLGRGPKKPAAAIIELKDWDTTGDTFGPSQGLVSHHGSLHLHPSEQVRGYVEYCRLFHSAVAEAGATVSGCVYFTRRVPVDAYMSAPHTELVGAFPIFTYDTDDIDVRFPEYLGKQLVRPDLEFARQFERGTYRQDRSFCVQMAEQVRDPKSSPFVLLDEQRQGFEVCRAVVKETLNPTFPQGQRSVVVIEGPPGSGKSVIAARLWADLVSDNSLPDGNIVLTTTSASQRSNWEGLFERVARSRAGRGVVMPANRYAPATTKWVGDYHRDHPGSPLKAGEWEENLAICREDMDHLRCPDDTFLVSIVDEAHALINPEKPKARAGPYGWPVALGPQAFHIMRCSRVSIFLMDSDQSFRDIETTTKPDIERWGKQLGAKIAEPISLADRQFRCGGSKDYMDWLEGCLGMRDVPSTQPRWRKTRGSPDGAMVLEVVDDPLALEESLRSHLSDGHTSRLVAAYGREWKTKNESRPHNLPPDQMDFDVTFRRGSKAHRWSSIWNYAPGQNYTYFVQAPSGTAMHDDPLSEVGCPYTVRGFDYDYLGVLWLKDFVRRGDRWRFDIDHIHETALRLTIAQARREPRADGPASAELLRRMQQVYRILLSRAIRGVYVWFEDEETRHYVESLLPH